MIKNEDGLKSNSENSSTIKAGERIFSEHFISTIWTFYGIENVQYVNHGKHCALWINKEELTLQKNEMIPLTNEQQKAVWKGKVLWYFE